MWGLVFTLVVLVLLLGLGYVRLLSALKDLKEQIQEKLQSGSGVRLASRVSKKEFVTLTKQIEGLFEQIERTNRIAFKEKRPWIWPSVILPTISGRL
ncbi:putative histidine kinase [Streptococcus sp. DD13]|nr:putative histidine kinase [Streptococcus sp. DD13]